MKRAISWSDKDGDSSSSSGSDADDDDNVGKKGKIPRQGTFFTTYQISLHNKLLSRLWFHVLYCACTYEICLSTLAHWN